METIPAIERFIALLEAILETDWTPQQRARLTDAFDDAVSDRIEEYAADRKAALE